ncbi:MAG TPA: hypothetical protein VK546_02865, partial [Gaiellales bacterium]|nr:hypothetical protein [Gaiellales bacterium]
MSTSSHAGQTGAGRFLPLSGIGFVILVLAAFGGLAQDTPGGGDSVAKVRSFYDTNSTHQIATAFVLAAFLHFALADIGGKSGISDGALQALNTLDADVWV